MAIFNPLETVHITIQPTKYAKYAKGNLVSLEKSVKRVAALPDGGQACLYPMIN